MFVFILEADYIVGPRQQCYKKNVCWTGTSGCPIGKTKKDKVVRTPSGIMIIVLYRTSICLS